MRARLAVAGNPECFLEGTSGEPGKDHNFIFGKIEGVFISNHLLKLDRDIPLVFRDRFDGVFQVSGIRPAFTHVPVDRLPFKKAFLYAIMEEIMAVKPEAEAKMRERLRRKRSRNFAFETTYA